MSVKVMTLVWEYSQAKEGDLLILLAIADHADDHGRAFPGVDRLAVKGRMSDRNVRHCLNALQASQELTIIRGGGRGRSNHYQINLSLLLSRAKEGKDFPENNTGKDFTEKVSLKLATSKPPKPGNTLPPNHQLLQPSVKEDPPLSPPQGDSVVSQKLEPTAWPSPLAFVDWYNTSLVPLGAKAFDPDDLTPKLQAKLNKALKAKGSRDYWSRVAENFARSPWLRGEVLPTKGRRRFKTTLTWLVSLHGRLNTENYALIATGQWEKDASQRSWMEMVDEEEHVP